MSAKNLCIFISGAGSNARKILDHFQNHVAVGKTFLYSNNPNSELFLEMSRSSRVSVFCFSKADLTSGKVARQLQTDRIDFIALAGFLLRIPKEIINRYPKKIVNIHPSLLPKFGGKGMYGKHVHRAVLDQKETVSGITIHYVNALYDEGAVIAQHSVSLSPTETVDSLSKKIQQIEHRYFSETLENLITQDF